MAKRKESLVTCDPRKIAALQTAAETQGGYAPGMLTDLLFATKLEMDERTLCKMKTRVPVRKSSLRYFAKACGVDPEYLLEDDPSPLPGYVDAEYTQDGDFPTNENIDFITEV